MMPRLQLQEFEICRRRRRRRRRCCCCSHCLPGANMGDFTVFFAAAAGPSGAVYAFEPQARMHQLLCTNMIIK
jgi:hypothetical protein